MATFENILFMFPGQGSQYSGMGKDWFSEFKECRESFEEASDFSGLDLKKLCFDGAESDLKATEITQPAILTTTVGIWRSLKSRFEVFSQTKNAMFAGHSLGEYSALVCSGYFSLGPVAKIVRHRGLYMQEAVPAGMGTMAAFMFKPKTEKTSQLTREICELAVKENPKEWVEPANFNAPEQIVVSGTVTGVRNAIKIAADPKYNLKRGLELPVSAPFHSKLMKPAAEKLAPEIKALKVSSHFSESLKYIPNTEATVQTLSLNDLPAIQKRFIDQITGAVRWIETIGNAKLNNCQSVLEIGPGAVLSGLAKRIDQELKIYPNIDRYSDFDVKTLG